MKAFLDCVPCVVRQSLEAVRHATSDEAVQQEVLRRATKALSEVDFREPSPAIMGVVHRIIRELTDLEDPYCKAREICNRNAMALYPQMKELMERSSDPLETALRLAIAGNTIDFVVDPAADRSNLHAAIDQALSAPLSPEVVARFCLAVRNARDILYLGDNAGEIVFDRLLIEQLLPNKVTFVVKGSPVINDVLYVDAHTSGLADVVEVIDNGSDMPGTILQACSEPFLRRFRTADVIISKGQGNYESLSEVDQEIFFLFKAKCSAMAVHLGCDIGALMLTAGGGTQSH